MSGATWQYSLLGLGIGTLVGMTGMGGGSLMTPLLILVFGFDPGQAVGTDLLHGAIFKSFGAARHHALGTTHVRLVGARSRRHRRRRLARVTLDAARLGARYLHRQSGERRHPRLVLRIAFSIVLLLSGIKMLEPLPGHWTDGVVLAGLGASILGFALWAVARVLSGRSGRVAADEPSASP